MSTQRGQASRDDAGVGHSGPCGLRPSTRSTKPETTSSARAVCAHVGDHLGGDGAGRFPMTPEVHLSMIWSARPIRSMRAMIASMSTSATIDVHLFPHQRRQADPVEDQLGIRCHGDRGPGSFPPGLRSGHRSAEVVPRAPRHLSRWATGIEVAGDGIESRGRLASKVARLSAAPSPLIAASAAVPSRASLRRSVGCQRRPDDSPIRRFVCPDLSQASSCQPGTRDTAAASP